MLPKLLKGVTNNVTAPKNYITFCVTMVIKRVTSSSSNTYYACYNNKIVTQFLTYGNNYYV